jgi:hypothetical protein
MVKSIFSRISDSVLGRESPGRAHAALVEVRHLFAAGLAVRVSARSPSAAASVSGLTSSMKSSLTERGQAALLVTEPFEPFLRHFPRPAGMSRLNRSPAMLQQMSAARN